jgi:hypothetical protein
MCANEHDGAPQHPACPNDKLPVTNYKLQIADPQPAAQPSPFPAQAKNAPEMAAGDSLSPRERARERGKGPSDLPTAPCESEIPKHEPTKFPISPLAYDPPIVNLVPLWKES